VGALAFRGRAILAGLVVLHGLYMRSVVVIRCRANPYTSFPQHRFEEFLSPVFYEEGRGRLVSGEQLHGNRIAILEIPHYGGPRRCNHVNRRAAAARTIFLKQVREFLRQRVVLLKTMYADLGVGPKLGRVHEDVAKALADPVIGRADQIGIGQIVIPPDLVAGEPLRRRVLFCS
jgi:hypothetical protein